MKIKIQMGTETEPEKMIRRNALISMKIMTAIQLSGVNVLI